MGDPPVDSHYVGLVDSGDPAATFLPGQFEGVVCDPEGVGSGDDLKAFHHPANTLQ